MPRKPRVIAGQAILPGVGRLAKKRTDTPGQKRGTPEADEQAALIRWARLWGAEGNRHRIPALAVLLAVPNGGYYLSPAAAGKLKAAGLLAGTWDMFLPVPVTSSGGTWHLCGCWIEMKSARGSLSPEQKRFQSAVGIQYDWFVCHTWHAAARALLEYLGIPRTHPAWSGLEVAG